MKILRVSCKVSSVGNFVDGFGGDTHIDNDDYTLGTWIITKNQ